MLAHSKHISRDESQPGDFVVFGLDPSTPWSCWCRARQAGTTRSACPMARRPTRSGSRCRWRPRRTAARRSPSCRCRADQPAAGPAGRPVLPARRGRQLGPQTIEALQWKLRVTTDGVFGPVTRRRCNIPPRKTAMMGPVTIRGAAGAGGDPERPVGAAHHRGTAARAERGSVLTRLRIWLLACANTSRSGRRR